MAFDVYIEKLGDDAKGKLDGLLTLDKHQHYIESIKVINNSEFSRMFSSSISDFKLIFRFTKIQEAILPLEYTLDMKGSFALRKLMKPRLIVFQNINSSRCKAGYSNTERD